MNNFNELKEMFESHDKHVIMLKARQTGKSYYFQQYAYLTAWKEYELQLKKKERINKINQVLGDE